MPNNNVIHSLRQEASAGQVAGLTALVKRSVLLSRLARASLRLVLDLTTSTPNVIRQLRAMQPAPPVVAEPSHKVLIFSLRGWPEHLGWETTIARALHLRGAQTLTLICDGVLPACEPRTIVDDYDSTCDLCYRRSSTFMRAAQLPYRRLSEFVSSEEIQSFVDSTAGLSLSELEVFESGGVPVGALVAASVNRHLLQGGLQPEQAGVYRRFVIAGLVAQRAIERLLDDYQPDVVLEMNGLFYAEAILLAIARLRDIPVWTYERANKKVDALIFALNEPVIKQDFEHDRTGWSDRELSAEENAALDAYLSLRESGNVGSESLWPTMQAPGARQQHRARAVLFTNVLWDTAVYQSDIAFGSMGDWVSHTISWFEAHPDYDLIIRIHPAEVRVPFKESRSPVVDFIAQKGDTLPANVRIVGPEETIDSYALVDQSDIILVYTSTIGLEAVLRGKPALVAGRTHYRGKGFTLDPDSTGTFDDMLAATLADSGSLLVQNELVRRYAFYFFFVQIVPFPLVTEQPSSYIRFNYDENRALAPGVDRALDAICESLLTGKPLVNPELERFADVR